jgi:hypothetical protein
MDLVFEATKGFEKDLDQLDKSERNRIIEKINEKCQLLLSDRRAFRRGLIQPCRLKLAIGFKSSLYALKVPADWRVILAVDDDPIFDQILVTLLRVVRDAELTKAYQETAQVLYQPEGLLRGQAEEQSEPHQATVRRIRRDSRRGKNAAID